jgi:hypothetical protein
MSSSWGLSWLNSWGTSWSRSSTPEEPELEGSPGGIDVKTKERRFGFAAIKKAKEDEDLLFLLSV